MKLYLPRFHRRLAFGLALLCMLIPLRTASAQNAGATVRITQVDNSKFPQVTVYVSVVNAFGEPLPVDPNRIQIFENGTWMQPTQISGSGGIGSLTTLLVIDVSGSMNYAGKLASAKAAAQAYVDQLRPGDQAGLLVFNTQVTYRQAITPDREVLRQAIAGLQAQGDTALYDALDQAAQILQEYTGRKAVIVLTDGLDNRSRYNADEVIQAIGAGGLSISTIGLGDPAQQGSISALDEAGLQSLATRAGGVYGYANDPAALRGLYERYGRTLQSEYRITYVSPLKLRDGLNRTLTVSLGNSSPFQTHYNPGGVLPEVERSASWPTFGLLLGGLLVLLFLPGLVNQRRAVHGGHAAAQAKQPRIKLK